MCANPEPRRLLPQVALPPYAFVPGRTPHPTRDPQGHSFGRPHPKIDRPVPEQWSRCHPYLLGIDCFNAGFYWEAHEAWEEIWHAAGRRGDVADFLKGLIALSAAGVKAREGREAAVRHHALRGARLLREVSASLKTGTFMGLDLIELAGAAEEVAAQPARYINTAAEPVVIVMPFALRACPKARE